ncbi:hypothetical protein ACFQHV_07445 [Promicromonospora thailandica]|uniref:Uncharacterized protein n=1 Tax=Promicromonospora thailandica TaxID=765201 RepID=A0A9X2G4Y3_9MICO|nr:hypothetical protein [Promicromonospora thailandica]MCP2267205.1 hypothetical protein [Promicromonospora thailandica]BFF17488.1 hypothetical protein GCM10025730_10090 [Promicromonospora thailandica]
MTTNDRYHALRRSLEQDPDLDVTAREGALFVRQTKFAYLAGEALAVRLPSGRADDLITRDIAVLLRSEPEAGASWVTVSDPEDWPELASEAHELAGGHQPGNRS